MRHVGDWDSALKECIRNDFEAHKLLKSDQLKELFVYIWQNYSFSNEQFIIYLDYLVSELKNPTI